MRGSEPVLAAARDCIPSRRSKRHPLPSCPPCPTAGEADGDRHRSLQNCSPAPGWDRATSMAGQAARMGTGTGAWDRRSLHPQSCLCPSRGTPSTPTLSLHSMGPCRALPSSPVLGRCSQSISLPVPQGCPATCHPQDPPCSPRFAGATLFPALYPIQSTKSRSDSLASIPAVPQHSQLPEESIGDPTAFPTVARMSRCLRRRHRVPERRSQTDWST